MEKRPRYYTYFSIEFGKMKFYEFSKMIQITYFNVEAKDLATFAFAKKKIINLEVSNSPKNILILM